MKNAFVLACVAIRNMFSPSMNARDIAMDVALTRQLLNDMP